MNDEDIAPGSVTELKGMFGRATKTVSIEDMNRAIAARVTESEDTAATPGHTEVRIKPSEALNLHRAAIRRIVEAHNAVNPRVFGSALFGLDTEESDLDILIDPTEKLSLFDIGAIRRELCQLLGVPVDVLTPDALPDEFRARAIKEARPV